MRVMAGMSEELAGRMDRSVIPESVMRRLDPRIHDELPHREVVAKRQFAEPHHGLPGQARQ
jgi:hypothetical protein